MTEVSRRPKLISYYCVFKFFQRSVDGNHMMRFQSETFIFKFLWRSVAGFCVVKIFVLVDFIETLFHLTPFSPEFFLFLCPGLWHSRWAIQRYTISASTGWKHRWNLLHRQRGSVWHLLQNAQAEQSYIRGLESPGVRDHEWCDHMPAVPRTGRTAVEIAEVCLWIFFSAWHCNTD